MGFFHLKPSVIKVFKSHGFRVDISLHHWLYFVFYHPYVKLALAGMRFVEKYLLWFPPAAWIAKAVFQRYHAKILALPDSKKIFTLDKDVILGPDNERRIIPFQYANKIIFKGPQNLAVMDCPCKAARGNVCRPYNCCIAVGQDIVQLWMENCRHYNVRRIDQNEAQSIISTLRKTGHITMAFLKVGTGGQTGVICSCCPKCCVSLEATRVAKKMDPMLTMVAQSGYSVKHDPAKCQACRTCVTICPFSAISFQDNAFRYNRHACMGCGLCEENCKGGALSLYVDPNKVLPLDIDLAEKALKPDAQNQAQA